MSKRKWYYVAFFVVLAAGFYLVLMALVPGIWKKRIPPVSYVRPFSFVNQDGQTVTEKDMAGKVYVAEFFFTTCPGICPRMNKNMKLVYDKLKGDDDFFILSHTSMPEVDSPAVLKAYAKVLGVDTKHWIFLTGRKDSLYNMARVSYTIDDSRNNLKSIDDDFLHTQLWALVDRKGDVRKIYDGLRKNEVEELIEDAEKLLKENK